MVSWARPVQRSIANLAKGQLISKANFLFLIWTKKMNEIIFWFLPEVASKNRSNQKIIKLHLKRWQNPKCRFADLIKQVLF